MGNSFRQTMAGIFSNPRMSVERMQQGHRQATFQRACADPGQFLIVAQDTCFFNYTSHPAMEGLGRIQGHIRGIVMHSAMLFCETGQPLGLLDQQYWSRQGAVDYDGIESDKWLDGLHATRKQLNGCDKHIVLVQDREADVFRFIKAATTPSLPPDSEDAAADPRVSVLVRVHQPRNLQLSADGQILRMDQIAMHLPVGQQQHKVTIDRGSKQVTLTLSLQAARMHVLPDQGKSIKKHKTAELSLIVATEVAAVDSGGADVFKASEAAQWYLLTALPIDTQEDMVRILHFYSLRWRIERFHYTLKSGALKVEQLQFDDLQTMIHALSFYAVAGWKLLALTYGLRQDEAAEARRYYDDDELEILASSSKKPIRTVGEATLALGKLVGFVPTTRQPYPGVKILAEAIQQLYHMARAVRMTRNTKPLQD
jgi:hypothetical protein